MQRMDAVAKQSPWLVSQCYDLSFITFSAIFLFLPHLVHTITGKTKTTDMTADDLELVLAFAENGEYSEHPAETPRLSNNFTRALAASAVT